MNKFSLDNFYKVKSEYEIEKLSIDNLIYNYKPIIGSDSLILYLLFVSEAKNIAINSIFVSHERLESISNMSLIILAKSIKKLEAANLLKIFVDKEDNVIYVLNEPRDPRLMKSSLQVQELLSSKIGKDNLRINNRYFENTIYKPTPEQEEITEEITLNLKQPDVIQDIVNPNVNYDPLKKLLGEMGIAINSIWSEKIEKQVKNAMFIYNLNIYDIAEIFRSSFIVGTFNIETFKRLISGREPNTNAFEDLIDSPDKKQTKKEELFHDLKPVDFIKARSGRIPTMREEMMILKLSNSYILDDSIINVLIDYSIIRNNGAVVSSYIIKIAESLIENNILNLPDVIRYLRMANQQSSKKPETKETVLANRIEF